jgi:hypothetical protein
MKSLRSLQQACLVSRRAIRFTWWKVLLLFILCGIGIVLAPKAYCALADCTVKDKWCASDCSRICGQTHGLGVIVGCSKGAYGCIEDWIPDAWGMRCTDPSDCKVTECASTPPGYGCFLVGDGRWDVGRCSAFPGCRRQSLVIDASCCGSSPTPCPKTGPKITPAVLQPTPAYPLVFGQDPGQQGISIPEIWATAGEHDCRRGSISDISVRIRLREASIQWINGELSRRYPGAHVLGTYPIEPQLRISGLGTADARASFHFIPRDPGDYAITVTVTQDDGQVSDRVFQVHVALYESTITH